jgi:hypothetical protein
VAEHSAEIEAAGAGGRHWRSVYRAWDLDGAVTRDPTVALVIQELWCFHRFTSSRHCEELSDEAIQFAPLDCFATLAMTGKDR